MRLSKIEVTGLFHKYNHSIPLNLDNRITIIHGLNGSGKTTLLEFLNNIIKGSYGSLQEVPFQIFRLNFDDDTKINVYKNYFFLAYQSILDSNYDQYVKSDYYQPDEIIFEHVSNASRCRSIFCYDGSEFKEMCKNDIKNDHELLKIKDQIQTDFKNQNFFIKISDLQKKSSVNKYNKITISEVKVADVNTKVQAIEIEKEKIKQMITEYESRIFSLIDKYEKMNLRPDYEKSKKQHFLENFVDLKKEHEKLKFEYLPFKLIDNVQKSEKRTDLTNYLAKKQKIETEINEIERKIEYCKDRILEIDLNESKMGNQKQLQETDEKKNIYEKIMRLKENYAELQSTSDKLTRSISSKTKRSPSIPQTTPEFLRELKSKIPVLLIETQRLTPNQKPVKFKKGLNLKYNQDFFVDIIRSYLHEKKVEIKESEGLQFFDQVTGTQIFQEQLSSGERHLIILFYNMIFKTHQNSLILIDEPELSLHISWQIRFIEKLNRLLKLEDKQEVQILIATHSPEIIHDRWDLTVPLGGE